MHAGKLTCLAFHLAVVSTAYPFCLGVENLTDEFLKSVGNGKLAYRVAVITNQTGRDQAGHRTIDILVQKKLNIAYILAPEHGFEGTISAGTVVKNEVDKKTGIPIVSLYETTNLHKGKRINESVLNNIDVIFFDIQDSGMRHYTYISTLFYALDSAAKAHKRFVVLDRPNLLGDKMEGPLVDPHLHSFIGIAPIPLRHGMTIGELARFFNTRVLQEQAQLFVVPMKGYTRTMHGKSLLLAPLSPNLTTIESCYGYSFLGLLGEIEPFEVGVGTSLPFRVLLLPDVHTIPAYEWAKIKSILAHHGVPSTHYSHYHTAKKKTFTGLQLHITDPNKMSSFDLLVDLLLCFKQAGVAINCKPVFDKAVGSSLVRMVVMGTSKRTQLNMHVSDQLEKFMYDAKESFLYKPIPRACARSISHSV